MPTLNRRGLLKNCALLAAGAAGGMLVPRGISFIDVALAQGKTAPMAEEQLRKLKLELPKFDRFKAYQPAVRVRISSTRRT